MKGEAISDWENSKCKGRGWVEWAQERDAKTSRAFHRRETDVQEMHEGMPDLIGHQGNANQDHDAMLSHTLSIGKNKKGWQYPVSGKLEVPAALPYCWGEGAPVYTVTQQISQIRVLRRHLCTRTLSQCFSNFSMGRNPPRTLLKGRFWFSGSRAGPKILHF